MRDKIISYREMCDNENTQTLQRGMNYRLNQDYSVILMSQRKNAPYKDRISENGLSIEYQGHDISKSDNVKNPKLLDQPQETKTGKLTQNGLFAKAVDDHLSGLRMPEIVRVYEKIFAGVWSEKGFFRLINYSYENDGSSRRVYIFILTGSQIDLKNNKLIEDNVRPRSRIIPSKIKKEVWVRDQGVCCLCGAADELHFDHDLPFSKGGSSITVDNVRILCARHNLEKSDKIQ